MQSERDRALAASKMRGERQAKEIKRVEKDKKVKVEMKRVKAIKSPTKPARTTALFRTSANAEEPPHPDDVLDVKSMSDLVGLLTDPLSSTSFRQPMNPYTPAGAAPFRLRSTGELLNIPLLSESAVMHLDLLAATDHMTGVAYYQTESATPAGPSELMELNTLPLDGYDALQLFASYFDVQNTSAALSGHGTTMTALVDRTALGVSPQWLDYPTARSLEIAYSFGTMSVPWNERLYLRQANLAANMTQRNDFSPFGPVAPGSNQSDALGVQNAPGSGHTVVVSNGVNSPGVTHANLQSDAAWIGGVFSGNHGSTGPNPTNDAYIWSRRGGGWNVNTSISSGDVAAESVTLPASTSAVLADFTSNASAAGFIVNSRTSPAGLVLLQEDSTQFPTMQGLLHYVDMTGGAYSTTESYASPGPSIPVLADYHKFRYRFQANPLAFDGNTARDAEAAFALWGTRGDVNTGFSCELLGTVKHQYVIGAFRDTSELRLDFEFNVMRPDVAYDTIQLAYYTSPNEPGQSENWWQFNSARVDVVSTFANAELVNIPSPFVFVNLGTDYPAVSWNASVVGNARIALGDTDLPGFIARTGMRNLEDIPSETILEPLRVLSQGIPVSMDADLFISTNEVLGMFTGKFASEKADDGEASLVMHDQPPVMKTHAASWGKIGETLKRYARAGERHLRTAVDAAKTVSPYDPRVIAADKALTLAGKLARVRASAEPVSLSSGLLAALGLSSDYVMIGDPFETQQLDASIEVGAIGYAPFPVLVERSGELESAGARTVVVSHVEPVLKNATNDDVQLPAELAGYSAFALPSGLTINMSNCFAVASECASMDLTTLLALPAVLRLPSAYRNELTVSDLEHVHFSSFLTTIDDFMEIAYPSARARRACRTLYFSPATADLVDSTSWMTAAVMAAAGMRQNDVSFTGAIALKKTGSQQIAFAILPMAKKVVSAKEQSTIVFGANTAAPVVMVSIDVRRVPGHAPNTAFRYFQQASFAQTTLAMLSREVLPSVLRGNMSPQQVTIPILDVSATDPSNWDRYGPASKAAAV